MTTHYPIGGLFVLSSYIPLRKKMQEVILSFVLFGHDHAHILVSLKIMAPNSKEIPVFWGHGALDAQVSETQWRGFAHTLAGQIGTPFCHYADDSIRLNRAEMKEQNVTQMRFHTYSELGHWFNKIEIQDLVSWMYVLLDN